MAAVLLAVQLAAAIAPANGAVVDDRPAEPPETGSVSPLTDNVARLDMRFEPEGRPDSGHVRVILTPTERSLSLLEARTAAEKAFIEALNEPGLGDTLTQIRIVVKLVPFSDKTETDRTYLFRLGAENSWRVELADPVASEDAGL